MLSDKLMLRLFREVGTHLADWPVVVRYRDPSTVGASASAYKANEGYGVVDLSPNNSGEGDTQLINFLHEIAHIKDRNQLKSCDRYQEPSRSVIKSPEYWAKHREDKDEIEADRQAWEWWHWALEKTHQDTREETDQQQIQAKRLVALLDYPEGG